jgi:hypothetical protein
MDLGDARTDGLKLSLKLYHARELQLNYEQLMRQAPNKRTSWTNLKDCQGNSYTPDTGLPGDHQFWKTVALD